jgi:regulator of RNase E activity RraA
LVRPGDVLVGDDDGVVVVPSWWAEDCIKWVEIHEGLEGFIKEKIIDEGVFPGKYYPPKPDFKEKYLKSIKE